MSSAADTVTHFPDLDGRPLRLARVVAWMLGMGIAIAVAILTFVPWVQTAAGTGQVVALHPADRVQTISAMVSGRVDRWYVRDGEQVRRGDPVARVVDNDPDLLARLAAERAQVLAEIAAVRSSIAIAALDVARSRTLFQEGLSSRRDYELSQIKTADGRAKLAESSAKLNRIDIALRRQSAQIVYAPRAGRIQQISATAGGATLVSAGDVLATLAPDAAIRVVELLVNGRDVGLVRPGRTVRLQFESIPAFQFSGWPTVANGMFDGRVRAVDQSAQPSGLFRVLVEPLPGSAGWPPIGFVRLGTKVRGWIRMETVSVGYELWRQLNDFPLEFRRPAADRTADAKTSANEDNSKGDSAKDGGAKDSGAKTDAKE